MKKAIEWLTEALKLISGSWYVTREEIDRVVAIRSCIKDALTELKTPRWETPEQWEKRTGEVWPENGAVRIVNPKGEWELMELWRAKQLEQDLARLDKDFGDEPEGLLIVCDRGEAGPPPDGWRPETAQ
jgi:hypothetical protein